MSRAIPRSHEDCNINIVPRPAHGPSGGCQGQVQWFQAHPGRVPALWLAEKTELPNFGGGAAQEEKKKKRGGLESTRIRAVPALAKL